MNVSLLKRWGCLSLTEYVSPDMTTQPGSRWYAQGKQGKQPLKLSEADVKQPFFASAWNVNWPPVWNLVTSWFSRRDKRAQRSEWVRRVASSRGRRGVPESLVRVCPAARSHRSSEDYMWIWIVLEVITRYYPNNIPISQWYLNNVLIIHTQIRKLTCPQIYISSGKLVSHN